MVEATSIDSTITSVIGTDCGVNDSIRPSSNIEKREHEVNIVYEYLHSNTTNTTNSKRYVYTTDGSTYP